MDCISEKSLSKRFLRDHSAYAFCGVKAIRTAGSTADWRIFRLIDRALAARVYKLVTL